MQNENPYVTNIESILKFLHGMHNDGLTIKGFAKLSDHPLLVRYLKRIFNIHPSLRRYMHWDISLVFTYYDRIEHNEELEFKYLAQKMMLFVILGTRRKHVFFTIYADNIIFKYDKVIFLPNKTLKHPTLTRPLQSLIYNAYKENIKLCLVN